MGALGELPLVMLEALSKWERDKSETNQVTENKATATLYTMHHSIKETPPRAMHISREKFV